MVGHTPLERSIGVRVPAPQLWLGAQNERNRMKLISLNLWGGKAYDPLLRFVRTHSKDTDIFCFQEALKSSSRKFLAHGAHANILGELTALLSDFTPYFAPTQDGFDLIDLVDFEISLGQATFLRKTLVAESEGTLFVYRNRNEAENPKTIPANFHYIQVLSGGKKYTIINIHGITYPGTKLDTPERLEQSRRLIDFLSKEAGPKILCGDFNLLPNTESIRMLENAEMENLIKTRRIPSTRSALSPFYGKNDFQKFADYIFVSRDVCVKDFRVFDVKISDHLPLYLKFA